MWGQRQNAIGGSATKLHVGLFIGQFDDYPQRPSELDFRDPAQKLLNLCEFRLFLPWGFNFAYLHQLMLVRCFLVEGFSGVLSQYARRG
jgi:hypothetical protein